jgi:hypothetical protein
MINGHDFQCHFAIELLVLRQVHLTHPTRAELASNGKRESPRRKAVASAKFP